MKTLLAVALTGAGLTTAAALAAEEAQTSYAEIVAKREQVQGEPIHIDSNYWLAWTGAWDTVIMKETRAWEHWLPEGSSVSWKRNLQGPPVITDLLAGKQQIGYIGDNPAIVSTTKREIAPVNLVAVNTTTPGRMCGHFIISADAPDFASFKEAAQWLDGKTVGVPRGSCADRLGQAILQTEGVDVTWQQMQAEVIVTSLQAGKIDAAAVYEPHSSKAVYDGFAKYAIAPAPYGEADADAIVMREDFIQEHRDIAKAWLKANIEALFFMREEPLQVIDYVKNELPGYSKEVLWNAIYGNLPAETGAGEIVMTGQMALTDEMRDMLQRGYDFLHEINVVVEPAFAEGAIQDDLINEVFDELGLDPSKPLFVVKEGDLGANPYSGDELAQN